MTNASQMTKAYVSMQIKTSSNPENICMLHTKCVNFIRQSLIPNQPGNCQHLLIKAQNIIAELEHALIIDDDLSKSLFYLYDYCYALLDQTDAEQHLIALQLLSLLRNTFAELLKTPTAQ